MAARKKADVVIRLLLGESLEDVSRDVRVEAHRLAAWRDDFPAAAVVLGKTPIKKLGSEKFSCSRRTKKNRPLRRALLTTKWERLAEKDKRPPTSPNKSGAIFREIQVFREDSGS